VRTILQCLALCLLQTILVACAPIAQPTTLRNLHELNSILSPPPSQVIAILGATLIDGTGAPPVTDSIVLIQGDRIAAVGPHKSVTIPPNAKVIDATGLTLLPGLIDAHFHLDGRNDRPGVFLRHGVTAVRDPGAWIETYETVRNSGQPIPRLFLAGPHLDCAPVAYPKDAIIIHSPDAARAAVNRFINQGAVVIKVYFRLPLEFIAAATAAAHARGVPVTAHLELVRAVDAIPAGLDGIEHVTSFGTSLAQPDDAARYIAAVTAKNAARQDGRYELWGGLDLDHCPRLAPTIELAVQHKIVLCPTLAVFELRVTDAKATPLKARGYENMLRFAGLYHRAGGRIVVGSHSEVPHAQYGWAYQRELELLVEAGLSPMQALQAATLEGARYFRAADRLGSIEPGKQADLILVEGDPLKDISVMRNIRKIMLNGNWIDLTPATKPSPTTRELLRPQTPKQ
jgi:imidazolonepropionase-like amidohydrolase